MASFTVRVEIHGARHDEEIYEVLHAAMESAGFSRLIEATNGKWYHLPPAEYNLIGDYTPESVRAAAVKAANTTQRENAVLVTMGGTYWNGLTEVE